MSSSPRGRESGQNCATEFPSPSPVKDDSYSTMISNFVSENLSQSAKFNEEDGTFNHRPLLDLISELNRRHTSKQSSIPVDQKENSIERISPTDIQPAKAFSPFRPVIVHRKYQVNELLIFSCAA